MKYLFKNPEKKKLISETLSNKYVTGKLNLFKGVSWVERYGSTKASEMRKKLSNFASKTPNRGMLNKKHTVASKKKISMKSKEYVHSQTHNENVSCALKDYYKTHDSLLCGDNNPMKRKETVDKAVATRIKNGSYKQSKHSREKISLGLSSAITKHNNKTFSYGISGKYMSTKNKKIFYYRSSYELIAMQIFEQMSNILKYEYETLSIPYEDKKGFIHNTIPDFVVYYTDGSKEIIEVKPEFKIKKDVDNTVLKLDVMKKYAKENGYAFSILTEKELNLK